MIINTEKKIITITEKELTNNNGSGGLEIHIPEAIGSPNSDDTIFIENYGGEIKAHIWNGEEDPQIITLKKKNVEQHNKEKN